MPDQTATILGKLEQIKDATKAATKAVKGEDWAGLSIANGDIAALAADIAALNATTKEATA